MTESKAAKRAPAAACRSCEYYYITHDPAAPYGCRALGFKSRRNPAVVVAGIVGDGDVSYIQPKSRKHLAVLGGGHVT